MQTPQEASNAALKSLIAKVNGLFGAKTQLADRLSKETGQTVPRQAVQLWLHPTPEKRVQPMLGMGLILLRVGKAMFQTKQTKKTKRNTK